MQAFIHVMAVKYNCIGCNESLYFSELRLNSNSSNNDLFVICPFCKRKYEIEIFTTWPPSEIFFKKSYYFSKSDFPKSKYPRNEDDIYLAIFSTRYGKRCELLAIANLSQKWIFVQDFGKLEDTIVLSKSFSKYFLEKNYYIAPALLGATIGLFFVDIEAGFDPITTTLIFLFPSIILLMYLRAGFSHKDLKAFFAIRRLLGSKNKLLSPLEFYEKEIYSLEDKIKELQLSQDNLGQSIENLLTLIAEMEEIDSQIYETKIVQLKERIDIVEQVKKYNIELISGYHKLVKMITIQAKMDLYEINDSEEDLLLQAKKEELSSIETRKQELILLADSQKLLN